jgi:hypothetical protein
MGMLGAARSRRRLVGGELGVLCPRLPGRGGRVRCRPETRCGARPPSVLVLALAGGPLGYQRGTVRTVWVCHKGHTISSLRDDCRKAVLQFAGYSTFLR